MDGQTLEMYQLDINTIIEAWPLIMQGLIVTLKISLISSVLAFIVGLTIAYFRNFTTGIIKIILSAFVEIVRNTPLLIQLYLYYKGLPNIGIELSPIMCGILALSFYTGVFISEVLRSGFNAVAKQQYEAAKSLGLNDIQTFMLVIFPQAIRIVIPPLGSQFINLIKNSSLVSFIAVGDVFYYIYKGAVDDFRFFEYFVAGGIIYMILTGVVAIATNYLEHVFTIPGRAIKV